MTQKQYRWIMGHTHIKTIKTSCPCVHYKIQDKKITDPVSPRMLLYPHQKNFPEVDKK